MTVERALKSLLRSQTDRMFLAEECAAPGADQCELQPDTTRQIDDESGGNCGFAFRHLTGQSLNESGGLEVKMAGRQYLVDAMPGDVKRELEDAAATRRTLHLLFLSFERLHEHRGDYASLLETATAPSVIVYCPWMYWEHLYAQKPETFRGWGITACDDYSEPEIGSALTQKRCKVVGFDMWMDIQKGDEAPDRPPGYFDGVRLHMSFAVAAAAPALQAVFCCNGRELVVRPANAWGVGDLFERRREGLVDPVKEYGNRVDTIKLANRIAATLTASRPEAIRRQLQRRLVEVEYWSRGVLRCDAGEPLRLHRPLTVTTWGTATQVQIDPCWKTVMAQSCDPVEPIATPTNGTIELPVFQSFRRWQMGHHFAEVKPNKGAEAKWIIGITCGRPAAQSTRRPELVGPLRRFAAQDIGSTDLVTISLLEWQLDGVATLALAMEKKECDVLLLTTPQVEDAVRQELARLGTMRNPGTDAPMSPAPGAAPSPDIVHTIWLEVPEYQSRPGGVVRLIVRVARQQLLRKKENTLDLYYNGHFGIVRSLLRLNEALGQLGQEPYTHALTLSHNNLGVFGEAPTGPWTIEKLLEWMNVFAHSDCAAAVEVFQLDPGADRRWDELSVCIRTEDDDRFRLVKRSWYPDDRRMEWPRTKPGESQGERAPFFSSNTWYLNLAKLRDAKMASEAFKTLPLDGDRSEKVVLTGEPVDLLSWPEAFQGHQLPEIGVFAVRFEEGQNSKNPFHRHQRFTVVLEDDQFVGLPEFRRKIGESLEVALKTGRLYPLTPATKRNVWGGTKISQRKGWDKEQIGETWEIGTHPAGPAMYVDDHGVARPLQQLTGPLDHMGKFLDCTSPLSIQVHPTSAGIRELKTGYDHGPAGAGRDKSKEEAFYVIAVAPARDREDEHAHLVSGFNRERLAAIANELLPKLAQWNMNDPQTTKAVVDALASAVADKLFDPLLTTIKCAELAEEKKRMVEAFKAEESKLSLARAIEFYAGQIGTAAQGSAELAMYAAAAGVIRGLEVLGSPLQPLAGLEKHCKDRRDGIRMKNQKEKEDEPLFGLFNAVQLKPGEWFRVPAGTPHAFQGGGNLVIEVSNRSDTTYRIADFGREYTPSRREMHYGEAMFSLGPHAFQDASTNEAYRHRNDKTHGVCHKDLEYRVHRRRHGRNEGEVVVPSIEKFGGSTYLFNLGGPVRVDTPEESLTLAAFGVALATPDTSMWLHLGQEDQVLEVRPRESAEQRQASDERGKGPLQAVWPLGNSEHATLVEGRGVVFEDVPKATKCLIYPGHVKYIYITGVRKPVFGPGSILGGHTIEPVQTDEFDTVLGDVQVAAMGERFHPLGGLRGSGGGMVINFGPGFCAGFFDDSLVLTKIDDGTSAAMRDQDKAEKRLRRLVARLNMFSAIGAVGRWLYIDPLTSRLYLRAPPDLEAPRERPVVDSKAEPEGHDGEPADEWTEFWNDPSPYLKKWIFGTEQAEPTAQDGAAADHGSGVEWPWLLHPRDKSVVGDDAIRLSGWLSAEAIALRCYLAVLRFRTKPTDLALQNFADEVERLLAQAAKNRKEWEEELKKEEEQREKQQGVQHENPRRRYPDPRDSLYPYWSVYHNLKKSNVPVPCHAIYKAILANPSSTESSYRRIIDDVARELAMVIKCLHKVLARIPQTSKLAFSRTVLTTDPDAWAFGLTGSADELVAGLSRNLEGVRVTRSYINSTTARAVAGFEGYLHGRTPL